MKFLRTVPLLLAALLLAACGIHTVDTGYEGIKVSFGKVEGDPLPPGLYTVNPFTTSIHQMDTRTLKWESKTDTYTKDVQEGTFNFAVNYNLKPEAVGTTYRTVGEDWATTLIPQQVLQALKNEIGQHEAVEIISNRQKVSDLITAALRPALDMRGISLTYFALTDVTFRDAFNKAVEAKVIAQQRAEQAQNQTEQIRQEAQQRVIAATAEAQSMKIRADALSQNPKLVQWEAVQKWNGQLPQYQLAGGTAFLGLPAATTEK